MAQPGTRETIGDESLENWKRLGSGGFGSVFRVKHKDWKFEVAIKLLHGDDGSGTLCSTLGREADHMGSAPNQYVPMVYGMYRGCPPGLLVSSLTMQGIVMELMERGSLLSLQQALSEPPPWALAFRLAHQVAMAMDFLHSKKSPLVHSDLKPGNVLLDAYLNAKISDFGLSTVTASVLNTSDEDDEGGTAAYTPPEAYKPSYKRVRSYDIYSYGILLWTILTGENKPYPGVDRFVLAFRIIRGDRPRLDKIDQKSAVGLEELVELMKTCWHQDPNKRPQFKECTEVTGPVFSRHEKDINSAVNEMLSKLLPQDPKASQLQQPHWKNPDAVSIADFIIEGLKAVNADPSSPSDDVVLLGREREEDSSGSADDGSLSSLYSSSSADQEEDNVCLDYLHEWGPHFRKLADICAGCDYEGTCSPVVGP